MFAKRAKITLVPPPPPQGYDLNTNLARMRTFQATERTLMAWIRTAISMISFGFTMVKFIEYLAEKQPRFHLLGTPGVGLILIACGILCLVVGDLQYRHSVAMQNLNDKDVFWSFAEYVALATAAIGVIAFISIVRSF